MSDEAGPSGAGAQLELEDEGPQDEASNQQRAATLREQNSKAQKRYRERQLSKRASIQVRATPRTLLTLSLSCTLTSPQLYPAPYMSSAFSPLARRLHCHILSHTPSCCMLSPPPLLDSLASPTATQPTPESPQRLSRGCSGWRVGVPTQPSGLSPLGRTASWVPVTCALRTPSS